MTILGTHQATDRIVVSEPTREVVELLVDAERIVYITEPVAVPDGGSGGGGLRGYAETAPIVTPITGAGLTGLWTPAPAEWRLTVPAVAGEVLEWSPAVQLGGGPAALDLAVVVAGVATRYLSTGTGTPAALGSMYTQGDYGTARLPEQKWLVTEPDVVAGTVTLCPVYRATGSGDTLTLGHADAPSRITLSNLGSPGGEPVPGGGGSGAGTVVYLGMGDPTVNPGNFHPVSMVAIDMGTFNVYEI